MSELILVINPGSTSTKVALFLDDSCIASDSVYHDAFELAAHPSILDQLPLRTAAVREWLDNRLAGNSPAGVSGLTAVAARGGLLHPLPSGTYLVDDVMLAELRDPETRQHAANLGALIGYEIATERGLKVYVTDPVCVDEMDDVARLSGLPELPRISLSHALSMKSAARRAADHLGRPYEEIDLVVVHLGGGISVSAHRSGRMVDVNNANDMGPFSPERVGTLPLTGLVKLISETPPERLRKRLWGGGGMVAHLGTNDAREVERRIDQGDRDADLVYRSMAYHVAKEIGAMAAAIGEKPDAIVLTGGLAFSRRFVDMVRDRVSFIATVIVYPGGDEMQALAAGALRAVSGLPPVPRYGDAIGRNARGG